MKRIAIAIALILFSTSLPASGFEPLTDADAERVSIVRGSTINLVSRESSLPVVVNNNLPGEVRVIVNLRSNSPKLVLKETKIQLTIPAGTTVNAQFPIQAIGSGNVVLVAWLTSLNGNEIGKRVPLRMVVNPDIETAAIVLFLGFVGILIIIGTYRTIKRRKTAAS
jgi:hypothetical protein